MLSPRSAAPLATLDAGEEAGLGPIARAPQPPIGTGVWRSHGSVCIVLHDFAFGGTERVALRLARAWAEAGRTVTIFCGAAEGPLAPLLAGSAVRVVEAPRRIRRTSGSVARLGRAAARFLATQPHDGCFIPGNYHWRAIPPIAALPRAMRPSIVAQLSSPISKPRRRGLRRAGFRWRMRRLLAHADLLVTLSESQRWEARRLLPETPVRAIPLPALADDAPAPAVARGKLVMAAGRLVPQKGFDDLIRAFALVADRDATLLILGEGPERARLAALADRLGVTRRIAMPGFVEDIRPALDEARLFVLSSRYEGYAAVVVEALAAGRRVLATDCTPATNELLTEARFGETIAIGDHAGLAAAIDRMLAEPAPDPVTLARSVERFRIGPVARAYLALFDSIEETRHLARG